MKFIVIALVALLSFAIFRHYRQRSHLKILNQDDFTNRKAQLIDVREPQEFERGHILGARNIPMTQLKQRLVEIRPDKPVYLYCQNISRSSRAANILRNKGYTDMSVLKGEFRKWEGKIKFK